MKFLILNTDYPDFLNWFYSAHPDLAQKSYAEQMSARAESLFGLADFYSRNLQALGHEAFDIYANNEIAQKQWAREHGGIAIDTRKTLTTGIQDGIRRARSFAARTPIRHLKPIFRPILNSPPEDRSWLYEILALQINHHKPDVILNQDVLGIPPSYMREARKNVRVLVGQHPAIKVPENDYSCYDIMISSFPATVERFKALGVNARLNRLAFEPSVVRELKQDQPVHSVTFVGSFHPVHSTRTELIETVCRHIPELKIWAPEGLPESPCIRGRWQGQAWGREMLQILHDSKITLNHHGNVPPFANNMRLYEATGAGAMLLTDWKENLHEMFTPGKEVIAYRSSEECCEMIRYYLNHEAERKEIARAGQQRTLTDHTYLKRMTEFVAMVEEHV